MSGPDTHTVTVSALGHRGDGVASSKGETVYVPFTLPGEQVSISGSGARRRLERLLEPSPDRVEPICTHFRACGGCQLQHMNDTAYRAFKHDIVRNTLATALPDVPVEPVLTVPVASRRRAAFSAKRLRSGKVLFGFTARRAHEIVPLDACPILTPEIAKDLAGLRQVAEIACTRRQTLRVHVTATETGLDVLLEDAHEDEPTRRKLVNAALALDWARLSYADDVIVEIRKPVLTIDGVALAPPPGAFLQASAQSEALMGDIVTKAVAAASARNAADLFCGAGSFALRLARTTRVTALDTDRPALAALDAACRATSGLKPVSVGYRDLFRNPVTARELAAFDAVVFDPPRAGAERQAREIAASGVRTVIAVSCNPTTLARDLSLLAAGGYRIASVQPVDQFIFSPHIECIALCERE